MPNNYWGFFNIKKLYTSYKKLLTKINKRRKIAHYDKKYEFLWF